MKVGEHEIPADVLNELTETIRASVMEDVKHLVSQVPNLNARRTFEVEALPDTHSHEVTERHYARSPIFAEDPETGEKVATGKFVSEFVNKSRVVRGGFMVYFPQGHSLYIENAAMLSFHKLNESGLVDMDSGLSIDDMQDEPLKERVRRLTQLTPPSRRAKASSLDASIEKTE